MVIPALEEMITVKGVLLYSDGNPVAGEWVKFNADPDGGKTDGSVSEQSDSAGRFTLKILKGLTGELVAERWLYEGLYKNCPKVDEIIAKSGSNDITARSNVIKLTTEQNVYEVELTLPFPRCEKAKQ